ncbi:MAG: hypothetical protein IT443_04520 [Phycisphaeraceae bacterium]|nr:hypothetical protein [Phycisphaeraceae bacterium]
MNLRVGPFVYRIQFVHGHIQHEGQACLGLCDNDQHLILISDQASESQQIQITCHEYMEAWLFHFGANIADKEDYCDLFGLAMTQFVMDLMQQLRPPEITPAPGSGAHAGGCKAPTAGSGSIKTDSPAKAAGRDFAGASGRNSAPKNATPKPGDSRVVLLNLCRPTPDLVNRQPTATPCQPFRNGGLGRPAENVVTTSGRLDDTAEHRALCDSPTWRLRFYSPATKQPAGSSG